MMICKADFKELFPDLFPPQKDAHGPSEPTPAPDGQDGPVMHSAAHRPTDTRAARPDPALSA